MTPSSPSSLIFLNTNSTGSPISKSSTSQSTNCEVNLAPSSNSIIATAYGATFLKSSEGDLITEKLCILPFPLNWNGSIFPFLLQFGQITLDGKKTSPQVVHFEPMRLYLCCI